MSYYSSFLKGLAVGSVLTFIAWLNGCATTKQVNELQRHVDAQLHVVCYNYVNGGPLSCVYHPTLKIGGPPPQAPEEQIDIQDTKQFLNPDGASALPDEPTTTPEP